jgi:biotin carboxyl carrier protein
LKLEITIDGRTYEVEIEDTEANPPPPRPGHSAPPSRATIQSVVVAAAPGPGSASDAGDRSRACRSLVAGIVTQVVAKPGDLLGENDLVLVLEAMKMETNVRAPVAGRLRSIKVASGDAVKVNQVLAEFE